MLRSYLIAGIICCCATGCASIYTHRAFSEYNNDPIEQIKAFEVTQDRSYRLCVVGNLRKDGFGDYQIFIPQERVINFGPRSEYKIPVVRTKSDEIIFGCESFDEGVNFEYTAMITGKDNRTLVIIDKAGQDVAEIRIREVRENTSPVFYALLPFTAAIDLVTFPLQAFVLFLPAPR